MYVEYYRLRDKPFRMSPDPAFLYLSPTHREAIAALTYSIGKMMGFLSLTGEVGTGKTLMLRTYLRQIDRNRVKALYLFNPDLTFAELVREMCRELELPIEGNGTSAAVRAIHKCLIKRYIDGMRIVLVVDEAHLMPVDTLERLRILSNLETRRHKLLQIVLSGQPELNTILGTHGLRQLKQRIGVSVDLAPLTYNESLEYLRYRLAKVSRGHTSPLDEGALKRIAAYSKGIPRVLNSVADAALLAGYASQKRPVTAQVVSEVLRKIEGKRILLSDVLPSAIAGNFFRKRTKSAGRKEDVEQSQAKEANTVTSEDISTAELGSG